MLQFGEGVGQHGGEQGGRHGGRHGGGQGGRHGGQRGQRGGRHVDPLWVSNLPSFHTKIGSLALLVLGIGYWVTWI